MPFRAAIEVPAWFHAFMQDTNDLDHASLDGAIIDDMHGMADGTAAAISMRMSQVEAANIRKQIRPIPCHRPFGIRGNLSQGAHPERGVPSPTLIAPPVAARCEDLIEIGLCRER